MLERLKLWRTWLAIAALIVFCAKQFGGWDIEETVNNLLNVLLPALVAVGIVTNPGEGKATGHRGN